MYRKIIRIEADDSPNVRLARKEIANGKKPSGKVLIPGVLTYSELQQNLATWDKDKIEAGIYGRFYKGGKLWLFPDDWLKESWERWRREYARAKAMGVDTGEGGDSTVWCIGGEEQLIKIISIKTPDTSIIPQKTIELLKEYNISPERCYFDSGGGGKEHVDYLRSKGYEVNSVYFGEAATEYTHQKSWWKSDVDKMDLHETRFTYKNRRTELYHKASLKVNPNYGGYGLPPSDVDPVYAELYRQLRIMPKITDGEGRYYLPPKKSRPNSKEESLETILGHSPDEADAFVLMHWGLSEEDREIIL